MVGSSSCRSLKRMKNSITDCSKYLLSSEDVLFEIFRRLPFESIFNYRRVSKSWLSLLSNPSFITRMMINRFTSPPWTLFYEEIERPIKYLVAYVSPNLHYQFISNRDGFSFRFLYLKIWNCSIDLLGSSNGLVLCSTRTDLLKIRYHVCNPLTEQLVSLPRPPRPGNSHGGEFLHGFISCESSSLTSTTSTYKVVRIPEFNKNSTKFDIEIFSSDLGEWKTYEVSCPQEVTMLHPFASNVVTRNDVLYWIEGGRNRIIAYKLNKNKRTGGHQCRLIELPEPEGRGNDDSYCSQCLGESEGFICYGQVHRRWKTLGVWVLEEDYSNGGWVWHLLQVNIDLKDIFAKKFRTVNVGLIKLLAFNAIDRNVVILGYDRYILAYNFETRRSEVLRPPLDSPFMSFVKYNGLPFVLTPRPTTLPPPSWREVH